MAIADFDNDGDYDIVINTNPGDCGKSSTAPVLLRNDIGQKRNWLAVKLGGITSNRDAIGATVRMYLPNGGRSTRTVKSGGSYLSQSELPVTIGLGKLSKVDSVEIVWPRGGVQKVSVPRLNTTITLSEAAR